MSKERFDCLYNDCVVRGAWEDGDCIESTPDLKVERIEFFSIYLVKADTGEQDWIADFDKRSFQGIAEAMAIQWAGRCDLVEKN